MTSTEIAAASKIMLGTTEAVAMYIGSNKIWEQKTGPVDTISEYVQNGLIFHLDGIDKGQGSDWTDLVGGIQFTANGSGCYSTSNSWHFPGDNNNYLVSANNAWGNFGGSSNYTVEVCYYNQSQSNVKSFIFRCGRGTNYPVYYCEGNRITWSQYEYIYENAGITTNSKYTVSINDDQGFVNKVLINKSQNTDYWDAVDDYIRIGGAVQGGAARNPMNGDIYSIRIYNRKLSQAEQLQNQIIDDQRFNLGLHLGYIENPNVENGSHMYINKNFHFISSHTYKVESKLKWLNNKANANDGFSIIFGIGKYKATTNVDGYRVYWHSSNNVYRNGMGVSYANSGSSSNEITISDQITGLTNEYYLTLFSNIRAYTGTMSNARIYYLKITDVTTDTVICNLVPKYNATRNIYYMQDTTDNSTYQFITLGSSMREESDLTIYENET